MSEKCLYCYQENNSGVKDYHPSCSKNIYGGEEPPVLDYSFSEMSKLAEKQVQNSLNKFSKQLNEVLSFVDFSFLSADFKEEYIL